MKRTTEHIAKGDGTKKNSSTPKNPQKKHKVDDSEVKAKRQIDFKKAEKKNDSSTSSLTDKPKVIIFQIHETIKMILNFPKYRNKNFTTTFRPIFLISKYLF